MKRGDIIIVSPPSPFNKPRPALIGQAYVFDETEKVTVALISSDLTRSSTFRIPISPTPSNGLHKFSEIQIDHLQTVEAEKIGGWAGEADAATMRRVDETMRLFFAL